MAAAALFEPQTASFGELVLRSRPRLRPDFARWSLTAEDEEGRQARTNLFVALGFVAAFMTFLSGLYVVDSAVYPQGYAQSPTTTAAHVDYD